MNSINMASPWINFVSAVDAFFAKDPEVKVVYNENGPELKLLVANQRKADALTKLLPLEKQFGNVILKIVVIPENTDDNDTLQSLKDALFRNGAVSDIWTTPERAGLLPITYFIFKKEVVQYFADDLKDPHGNRSTLYQELAKEIFGEHLGISFSTDVK